MFFEEVGKMVVVIWEFGGFLGVEKICKMLLFGEVKDFGFCGEVMFFVVVWVDYVDMIIRFVFEKGYWVLCDWYVDFICVY